MEYLMSTTNTTALPPLRPAVSLSTEKIIVPGSEKSAVSWGAVFAGATASAALAMILLMLGVGLGLSSVSPWASNGVSATTFGVTTILWLTVTQLLASAMGGYLSGRLRNRWASTHDDEVYFRDTAHGFLSWAVASLISAALLASAIGSIVGGAANTVGTASSSAASAMVGSGNALIPQTFNAGVSQPRSAIDPISYFVDALVRKDMNPSQGTTSSTAALSQNTAGPTDEIARIFINSIRAEKLPANDLNYLGQLIVQRTGLSQVEAEKRVANADAQIRSALREAEISALEAVNKARKASAYTALWLFISLLTGAFVASFAATFGGRQRDM
jgi:hypothetical protein